MKSPKRLAHRDAPRAALMDTPQASNFLGMSVRTLCNWRVRGEGPRFVRLGRAVRYRIEDLEGYLSGRRFRSTSEADGEHAPTAA